ncbi:MAG: hypothetical protein B1H03_00905 [Planctomycetales bacterium 4484_113]|nr:MAG: hypothetical protein B1H03_00905 [Planctomycetales bacterium 4484_113]
MKVLVIGNGGRECAIANTLLVSPKVTRLYITPENYGVWDPFGRGRVYLKSIPATDIDALPRFASQEEVNLTVVGPEAPLAAGIVDRFRNQGLRIVGPDREAAQLEASKSFAKRFCQRYGIPTGKAELFSDYEKAVAYLKNTDYPTVIKADGLAAGKGVIVCKDFEHAQEALDRLMIKDVFKGAGKHVLVEEYLEGHEISFFCFFDGREAVMIPPVSDYKQLKDGGEGPNTGGMGCMAPTPYATPEVVEEWKTHILTPFIAGCQSEGFDYRGVIYFGTIVTEDGLKLLEFNVRMGDPEAQATMPLLTGDLMDIMVAMESGTLNRIESAFSDEATVTVVVASKNYPYGKSAPARIEGLERVSQFYKLREEFTDGTIYRRLPAVNVFFAGVSKGSSFVPVEEAEDESDIGRDVARTLRRGEERAEFFATGGRVLSITARGDNLSAARKLAYEVVGNIHFDGMHYRTDIAKLE